MDHNPLHNVEIDVENLSPRLHCDVKTHVDSHHGVLKIRVVLTEKVTNVSKELILELKPTS